MTEKVMKEKRNECSEFSPEEKCLRIIVLTMERLEMDLHNFLDENIDYAGIQNLPLPIILDFGE